MPLSHIDHVCSVSVISPNTEWFCCSLLSGWITKTGKLLGPKMALGVFLKDTWCSTAPWHHQLNQGFATFWFLARCSTNWASPLHSKVEASH